MPTLHLAVRHFSCTKSISSLSHVLQWTIVFITPTRCDAITHRPVGLAHLSRNFSSPELNFRTSFPARPSVTFPNTNFVHFSDPPYKRYGYDHPVYKADLTWPINTVTGPVRCNNKDASFLRRLPGGAVTLVL